MSHRRWSSTVLSVNEVQFLEIDSWLSNFQSRMQDVQQKAAKLTEGLAAASVTKSSADGAVTVTVGANGALLNLELSRRIAEIPPPQLSALVMRTVREAQRAASAKVGEALQEFGDDGAILGQYANFQPPAPEEPPPGPSQERPVPTVFTGPPEPESPHPAKSPAPGPAVPPPPPPPTPPAPPTARPPARPTRPHDDDGDLAPW
jgi:DNA-binding protein YbaB